MGKRDAPTATRESREIAAGLASCGLSQASIAEQLGGIEPANISQWASGYRPVPASKAQALGALIGKDPSAISAKYRDLHKQIRTQTPEATDIDLDIARLHGDIRATNYVFAALISAMAVHRPAEARDVVDALRRTVPAQFRDHGLIRELLGAMDKARAAKRAKPDSA